MDNQQVVALIIFVLLLGLFLIWFLHESKKQRKRSKRLKKSLANMQSTVRLERASFFSKTRTLVEARSELNELKRLQELVVEPMAGDTWGSALLAVANLGDYMFSPGELQRMGDFLEQEIRKLEAQEAKPPRKTLEEEMDESAKRIATEVASWVEFVTRLEQLCEELKKKSPPERHADIDRLYRKYIEEFRERGFRGRRAGF
jgi:hypothetical protein